jgi:hypothetical protein
MALIRVLSPLGVTRDESLTVPALPGDLRDRIVGFLDNTKANFDALVTELARLLRLEHGVKAVVHRRKANAATPAPAELVAELAKACDVVFAGSAD